LQCIEVCCSVLQCVAVCCNVGIRDCVSMPDEREYGVATVSRIDKIIGLVCRIASLL